MPKVRLAKPGDAAEIVDFQIKMAMETEDLELDFAIVEKGVRAVFQDATKGQYHVVEDEGKLISSLLLTYEWSDWRNGIIIWLQSLYVLPAYRRQGIFKQMFEYLQAQINKDESLKGLRLYVDKSNHLAQRVYEAMGMDSQHYQMYEWLK
jgi:ribosomal protein S18 acetylase RimI-like enzyme